MSAISVLRVSIFFHYLFRYPFPKVEKFIGLIINKVLASLPRVFIRGGCENFVYNVGRLRTSECQEFIARITMYYVCLARCT